METGLAPLPNTANPSYVMRSWPTDENTKIDYRFI